MLGFNGGLLGKERTPLSVSGSVAGTWTANEHSVAVRAGKWPLKVVPIASISYSQSSVYGSTDAASNGPMTDGLQTGTQAATGASGLGVPQWIQIDLSAFCLVNRVVIGNSTASVPPGGFGPSYTNNLDLQYSSDNFTWTTILNTGDRSGNSFLYTLTFDTVTARYIRLLAPAGGGLYIGLTEFYALSPGQTYTP